MAKRKKEETNSVWADKPLDAQYLLDSGLLFEINRSILHLFGIAMCVKRGKDGLYIDLEDHRDAPEKLLFKKSDLHRMNDKLQTFLREYGHAQDDKRTKANGRGCQWVPQVVERETTKK